MQLFSMHRLCTKEGQGKGDGYPFRQGSPDLFGASGDDITHRGFLRVGRGALIKLHRDSVSRSAFTDRVQIDRLETVDWLI